MAKQIDTRSAASRRDYFRDYHAARRLAGYIAPKVAPVVKAKAKADPTQPPSIGQVRAAWAVRQHYLETTGSWPQRRDKFPESIEETLKRVK